MKKVSSRLVAMFISLIICLLSESSDGLETKVSAATTYITVEDFAKTLATEVGLAATSGQASSCYVNVLFEKGIIKDGDFTSYTVDLKRGDAVMLLNRADEFLNGDKLDAELVQRVIRERISDIGKVSDSKKVDVAKGYLKGFMKGYSNGVYCTDRALRVNYRITKTGAMDCLKLLKNKKLRAKVSPDGQLIRTTNLPKNASKFPYILASYPNDYYEWMLLYEGATMENEKGEEVELKNLVDYSAPKDVEKTTKYSDFPELKKAYLDKWVDKVKIHLEHIFNVDYRTISESWQEELLSTESYYGYNVYEDRIRELMADYVKAMKENRTIVECKTVAVDGSSLYFYNGAYYLRSYVKYRIISSKDPLNITDLDDLLKYNPFNKVFYNRFYIDLRGIKIGSWQEGHFDIRLTEPVNSNGHNLGVTFMNFSNTYYQYRKVK